MPGGLRTGALAWRTRIANGPGPNSRTGPVGDRRHQDETSNNRGGFRSSSASACSNALRMLITNRGTASGEALEARGAKRANSSWGLNSWWARPGREDQIVRYSRATRSRSTESTNTHRRSLSHLREPCRGSRWCSRWLS